jgi:DNA transformation protein
MAKKTPTPLPESVQRLGAVLPLETRAMFGGLGIYSEGVFFALIGHGILYFKVGDTNRKDFDKAGMGPFQPSGPGGETMSYYQVPDTVLARPATLKKWAEKALDVARAARLKRKPVKRTGLKPRAGR